MQSALYLNGAGIYISGVVMDLISYVQSALSEESELKEGLCLYAYVSQVRIMQSTFTRVDSSCIYYLA